MKVLVQNMHGNPLMPCSPKKARILLQEGKAKVIRKSPFAIQLSFGTSGYKQEVSLGIDAGSRHIGVSATTQKEELFSAEVELRTDVTGLLSTRLEARRTRRNRKTRYRAPRFNNRKKEEGWMAPTVRQKLDCHLKIINLCCQLMPIAKVTVEVADFDTQKIKNPNISDEEYQQGSQLGFWNVREYVLTRDNHVCQHCKGESKDSVLNVHHLESRKTGGNSPDNLITLCETCHNKYHKGEIKLKVSRSSKSLRDAAFMGIVRWAVYNKLKVLYPNVSLTYGYITKNNRIGLKLPKAHCIDAFCITGNLSAQVSECTYKFRCLRRHNRQIHKSKILKGQKRKANQAEYRVNGLCLFDKVKYDGKRCFISGRTHGRFVLRDIFEQKILEKNASVTHKQLSFIDHKRTGMIGDLVVIEKHINF